MSFARPIVKSNRQRDIVATDGQVAFTFGQPLFDTADLEVFIQPVGAAIFTQVTAGFTTVLSPGYANATVTFNAAPGAGVVVRLQGDRVQDRLTDVTRGGIFSSKAVEDEFDRIAIILQEIRRDVSLATPGGRAPLGRAVDGNWDALGSRLEHVGNPRASTDAVNEAWVVGYVGAALASAATIGVIGPMTAAVQQAAQAYLPTIGLTWSNFVAAAVGAPTDDDGSYAAVFVAPYSAVGGVFGGLLKSWLQASGRTSSQAVGDVATIFAQASFQPAQGGVLPFTTAQVHRAAQIYLPAVGASWANFVASIGGPGDSDGEYAVVFVAPYASPLGQFATLMLAYLRAAGRSLDAALTDVAAIWALSLSMQF